MTAAMWLWMMVVVAVERGACHGAGRVDREVEVRELESGEAAFHQIFPLRPKETADTEPDLKVPRCLQVKLTGICRANVPRWHYDSSKGVCRPFTYGGCQGNENNFRTERHCHAACPDEIPCFDETAKRCRYSESSCLSATCPLEPSAVCFVLPCSCQGVFLDKSGVVVTCEEAENSTVTEDGTTITTESTTSTAKPGDAGEDGLDGGRGLRLLVLLAIIMITVGMVLILLALALRKWRRPSSRSYSASNLVNDSPDSFTSTVREDPHVPVPIYYGIL